MKIEEAMETVDQAQRMLREFDAGLRKARAQDWADDAVPHEMAVAGLLVSDRAWVDVNAGLNEVYALLRSHLEAKVVVDDAMVESACSKYMSFSNRHSGFKDAMRAAIQAAVGGE